MSFSTDFLKALNKPAEKEIKPVPVKTDAGKMTGGASAGAPIDQEVKPQTTREKANVAAKNLEVYRASDEYRQNQQARNAQYQKDLLVHRMMTGSSDTFGPKLVDRKEEELKAEAQRWKQAADKEDGSLEEQKRAIRRQQVAALSDKERELLDRYAQERRDSFVASLDQNRTSTVNFEDNPLVQKYGRAQLDKLADIYLEEKNRGRYMAAQEQGAQEADKGFLSSAWGSAKTVAGNLAATALSPLSRIAESGGRMDSMPAYSAGDVLYGYSGGLRGQVAQNIAGDKYDETGKQVAEGGLGRQLLSYAYQGGMSAADSAARLAVTGNAGVAAGLAAMGSFNTTLSEAREKGATPGQAVALATATAGVEALTEKLPLDNLMDIVAGGGKGVIKNILKQTITEIGEEEASLVLSLLAEAAILRDKSSYNQRIQELTAQGMSEQEARKQANMELLKEAGETALISGISGGMSAVGGQVANRVITGRQDKTQTGAEAQVETKAEESPQERLNKAVAKTIGQDVATSETADDNGSSVRTQLRDNQAQLNTMEPVASIQTPANFSEMTLSDRKNWVINKLQSTGFQVDRKGFGIIKFAKKQLKSAFNYLKKGSVEQESFEAIPYVLENGAQISEHPAHKNREYGTVTFAAPVIINGKRGNMAVVVKQTTENFYKVHRILTPDGSVFDLSEKTNEAGFSTSGESPETGSLATNINPASDTIVAEPGDKVNGNVTGEGMSPNEGQSTDGGQNPDGAKGTGAAERNFSGKADYQELLYDGNVQPDRPGDVRPMEIPKTDAAGKRVTEFAANAYGADITTDEMAGQIESLIQSGDMSFDTRTNQQSLQNAVETVRKKGGPASARKEITRNIEKGKIRDGDIETAILLYSTYAQKGKTDEASEMLVDLAQMANITGRNLQLFKLLRRMTVEGQVMALQKEVRRSVDRMVKSGQVKAGYTTEFDPELVDNYRKAMERLREAKTAEQQKQAEQDAKRAQDAIYLAEAAKMPATFKAKWDAWRYMAMLGNVKTQVRNVAGNAMFVPYKVAKDNLAAAAERIFLKQEQRTKGFLNLTEAGDQQLLQWAAEDGNSQAIQDALQYSAKLGDDVSGQKIQGGRTIFKSKALESARKLVEAVPQKADMFFKNPYYSTSLAGFIKARGYTVADIQKGNVPEDVLNEARAYAISEAMKATFNDSNAVSDYITSLRYTGDNPVGKAMNILAEGILPFRRTPANIAVRAFEYSPAGFVKGVYDMAMNVKNGKKTAATAIDEMAAGLTGSAVMLLGYALASGAMGVKLTGSDMEEDEKRQGHQEYALEFSVDGQEYSYKIDWAAPANLPLFVGANLYNNLHGNGENVSTSEFTAFIRAMQGTIEPMLALSCLSSLNDLFEAGKYSDGDALYSVAAQAATSYITQGIPALLRQGYQASQEVKQKTFANSSDPLVRDTQRRIANIPIVGAAYQADSITPWGEEESRGSAGRRIFDAFFNPGTAKAIDNSELERELSRLGDAQEENVNPPEIAKTISYTDSDGNRHENLRLNEEQYTTLAKVQGQTAKAILDKLIKSDSYRAMTDAQKAKAVQSAYELAREKGREAALDGYTIDTAWIKGAGDNPAQAILRRQTDRAISDAVKTFSATDADEAYKAYSSMGSAERKTFLESASAETRNFIEARKNGVTTQNYIAIAKTISQLQPESGYKNARGVQKAEAIAKSSLPEAEKLEMMQLTLTDAQAENIEEAAKLGIDAEEYAILYRLYEDYTSGKGKKDRTVAAIAEKLDIDGKTAEALYEIFG